MKFFSDLLRQRLFGLIVISLLTFTLFKSSIRQFDSQLHHLINWLSPGKIDDDLLLLTFPAELTDLEKKSRLDKAVTSFMSTPPKAIVLGGDWSHNTASWVTTKATSTPFENQLTRKLSQLAENALLVSPLYTQKIQTARPQPLTGALVSLAVTEAEGSSITYLVKNLHSLPPMPILYSHLKTDWQELLAFNAPIGSPVKTSPINASQDNISSVTTTNTTQPSFLMYQSATDTTESDIKASLALMLWQGSPKRTFTLHPWHIEISDHRLNFSANAQIWPRISTSQIPQKALTLVENQPSQLWANKTVYINPSNDYKMLASIKTYASLKAGAWDWRPGWDIFLLSALLLVTALFYLLFAPRLSKTVNLLITSLFILLIFITQMTLAITQHWWLSGNLLIAWILLTQFGLGLQNQVIQWMNKARHAQDDGFQLLAIASEEKGDLDAAFGYLKHCQATTYTCDLLYQLAQQMERKRDYQQAVNVYQRLKNIGSKQHKNLDNRIQQLQQALSNKVDGNIDPVQTLIMPKSGLQLPQIGRFNIEKVIGQGAMGVVYLGQDPKIGRRVAIKTLNLSSEFAGHDLDDAKERFYREAETAGQLRHPNIVTIYDVGEEQGLAYIAMDFLQGRPMSDFIQPENLLPLTVVYQLIRQVAEALSYAHSQGIVHRDIKPANIIYNADSNEVIVTDFGIACVTDNSKTRTGTILGSPYYMSPEQLAGTRVDGRADIFSLGVTFFQLLTGSLPFDGDSLVTLTYGIVNQKHTQIKEIRPDLPPSANRIINKALQKKPEQRFQNADEMAQALTLALSRIKQD